MPSPATIATAPSLKKRSKLSPASPHSTAFSPPLTASRPRSSPIIRFRSSSPAIQTIPSLKRSKPPPTASSAWANPSCAVLRAPTRGARPKLRNSISPGPSKKLFLIFPPANPSLSFAPATLVSLQSATPNNSSPFSKTASPALLAPRRFKRLCCRALHASRGLLFSGKQIKRRDARAPRPAIHQHDFFLLLPLLLRPRFRRHHPVCPVIHHQVAVVFSRVFDQPISKVIQPVQMWPTVIDCFIQSLVALCFDHVCAVAHTPLHERHQIRVTVNLQVRWLVIVRIPRLFPLRDVCKVIHGRGNMQQHPAKRPRIRIRLVVVLILRQILRDDDQFPPDVVPLFQHRLRSARCRFRRLFLRCLLRQCRHRHQPRGQRQTCHPL